jgi:hypothetical protein
MNQMNKKMKNKNKKNKEDKKHIKIKIYKKQKLFIFKMNHKMKF